jgi:hypothetical protein
VILWEIDFCAPPISAQGSFLAFAWKDILVVYNINYIYSWPGKYSNLTNQSLAFFPIKEKRAYNIRLSLGFLQSLKFAFISIQEEEEEIWEMSKRDEPVVGVPFYVVQNPYQAGAVPPNAVFGDPKGIPIQQTIYRDSPAPFNCVYCGNTGITTVRL